MMRIKQEIEKGRSGVFKIIPLLDNKDRIAWLGKYPNMAAVEEEKLRHGNIAFEREFNLRIISDDDQVIPFEWIKTYDDIPKNVTVSKIIMAVDLAISEKDTADKTAIVSAAISGWGKEAKIYFLPHPVNKRMDFATMLEKVKNVFQANLNICQNVKILVEDVGYQRAAIQALSGEGLPVEGFKVNDDKRARLITVSGLIKNGQAIFPKIGSEIQIQQITGFGVERFDDLVDATTMILFDFLKEPPFPSSFEVMGNFANRTISFLPLREAVSASFIKPSPSSMAMKLWSGSNLLFRYPSILDKILILSSPVLF